MKFKNRKDAGQKLASEIIKKKYNNPIVFALPRGGVPVAYEVAKALHAPLDIVVVRKLGVPTFPEVGFGAIAPGMVILDEEIINNINLSEHEINYVKTKEEVELRRRIKDYKGDMDMPELEEKTAILVDDGIATGITAKAAIRYLKSFGADKVVLAVPVCSPESVSELQAESDDVICLEKPLNFQAVGEWYEDFRQTSDDEVKEILNRSKNY